MSWLSNLLGGKDPMAEANKYLNKIPGTEKQYLDPIYQRGERAGSQLEDIYGQLAGDPSAYLSKLMEGYKPSEGYQLEKEQALGAAANTAAAGGMLGSAADQRKQAELASALASKDMQQYLSNLMGLQSTGLQGEQNLYGYGTQAGSNLATSLANLLGQQGAMAAEQAQASNQLPWQVLGTLGGYGLGGPMGGALGKGLSGWLFGGK